MPPPPPPLTPLPPSIVPALPLPDGVHPRPEKTCGGLGNPCLDGIYAIPASSAIPGCSTLTPSAPACSPPAPSMWNSRPGCYCLNSSCMQGSAQS
ncbi:hypothetical protein EJB05_49482 [Eragrostis curvula]|uniref:Uncharacterized protein n=1 Tax=Eragrostis curvula TaxID=38414 RepID=A0A5J9T5P0_9POAL|nr:hypothetical protein EJB05_49482 [Eragrostis curvula]